MATYVGLLRGINVGGKNKIKMAELREALVSEGFQNVKTYIQSGNVLFESEEAENLLRKKMEKIIAEQFGLRVPIVLRTAYEWKNIIGNCPFTDEQISKAQITAIGESLYVAMLAEPLLQDGEIVTYASETEEYEIRDREIYLLFHESIRNSKLAAFITRSNEYATVRNWKTINKLNGMLPSVQV
ncbi:DUF1697 domain-containing protein [Bacillus sp. RAR_GA_16]|uniref:DUF1697 domain-containing protein n=1 Tax=Bacillus sp. RAR_GA_16 TaxID=2876774 RepID=UPI001CCD6338|nr:DUF1697 domain-containing protein [Bacillus sp. RAR_GA_16]MCA0170484.1 DUF1697 domain-containing protein [Bacillus sp. RAR_GA_16]